MRLAVGARVRHETLGEGTVEALRRGGRVAVVRLDASALACEIAVTELLAARADRGDRASAPTRPASQAQPERQAEPKQGVGDQREPQGAARPLEWVQGSTLEAMRLGVVPLTDLDAYTVGRDRELAIVDADLEQAARGGAVRAFLGDYGVGKTHLLELLQQRALGRGFLSALVMLDPSETPPSQPKRVYRALMRALRYPDRPFEEGAGLRPLLEKAARSREALALLGLDPPAPGATPEERLAAGFHLYLSPAVAYLRALQGLDAPRRRRRAALAAVDPERSVELLLDWLEGHPTISNQDIDAQLARQAGRLPKIYSLLDFRPWSRIYGYLLSGLAAVARAVGYAGLVVTLDEAEFYALLSKENRLFASHLFKSWTFAASGWASAPDGEPPEATGPLPFDASEIEIGGYGIQQRLPGRYRATPGLAVVFAMTPSPEGVSALEGAVPADRVHTLAPLEHGDYMALATKVCDVYATACPGWTLPPSIVEPLGKVLSGLIGAGFVASPRHAMKFLIEFLDVVRHEPASVGALVRGLQAQLTW
jgi:hypothetical protein